MKHLLFTAFLLLGTFNYAQTKVIVPHPETGREMFYFNEEPYKDYVPDKNHSSEKIDRYLRKGNKYVEIQYFNSTIELSEIDSSTGMVYAFVYNKEKLLVEITSYFQTLPIGVWKEYNDKGEITKEDDWDKRYKMSIECLMQIMKERYDIDLIKDPVSILYTEKTRPIYIVTYSYGPYTSRWITIDVNTGETLFDKRLLGDFFNKYEEQIYRPK
ncbi:hypothetical protein [Capnocytophaga sp. oral taxon 338]|uniref:hypothetical protein n=1 Tax=Capnocytophaga sp. oral taxon 338 TaxID=710239 RepID=UPI000202B9E4|nr:hypothetical protein [Capnocytophaga sp. oral taxon 338]EGD34037.1 hypothetical protein HMPREF9071_1389 [Capnocytophaga sp. oral taxon 338 str. F0234]